MERSITIFILVTNEIYRMIVDLGLTRLTIKQSRVAKMKLSVY
jgi:hypothetical protein